ncbi:hypothetical protein ABID22_002206 [Pontibacter aydingkolensis]|nr:hypothetical protein [Pontibacter aydingkolensis]
MKNKKLFGEKNGVITFFLLDGSRIPTFGGLFISKAYLGPHSIL